MTAKDKTVERKLSALKRQLAQELCKRLARCATSAAHQPTELLDMVSDGEYDDLTARIAEADSLKLAQIEEALQMLQEGRYGICQRCNRRIPRRRLTAIPFATFCMKCKRREEMSARSRVAASMPHDVESPVQFNLDEQDHGVEDLKDIYREVEANSLY